MRNNILAVLIIKSVFLLALLGILIFIFRRLFAHVVATRKKVIHHHSEMQAVKKSVVHVVRQLPKNRKRVIIITKGK